jgi:hypothetical protein
MRGKILFVALIAALPAAGAKPLHRNRDRLHGRPQPNSLPLMR